MAVTGLIGLASVAETQLARAECSCTQNIGHRGTGKSVAGDPFAENTIPSFKKAFDEGAGMIELDVMHTSDGKLVVIHDPTLDRTTSGKGCVGERTLSQLKALDAAKGTAMAGKGVTIPTLEEVLAAIPGPVNIELKMSEGRCPATNRKKLAADVVAAMKAAIPARSFLVSSFDTDALDEVKKIAPDVPLGFLTGKTVTATVIDDVKRAGYQAINPAFANVSATVVERAHQAGLRVYPYTVNAAAEMRRLLTLSDKLSVDGIITDDPDVMQTTQRAACPAACPTASTDAGAPEADGGADDAGSTSDAGAPAEELDASADVDASSDGPASPIADTSNDQGGCSVGGGGVPLAWAGSLLAGVAWLLGRRRRRG